MQPQSASDESALDPVTNKIEPGLLCAKGLRGVLVIEDEEILRLLLEDLLGETGYRPVMACNGEEAVKLFNANKDIAIVITDMMMPVMDGHQTISILRRIDPSLKIIAMSGSIEAAANLPADIPFIPKPLNPDIVLQTVKEMLNEDSR